MAATLDQAWEAQKGFLGCAGKGEKGTHHVNVGSDRLRCGFSAGEVGALREPSAEAGGAVDQQRAIEEKGRSPELSDKREGEGQLTDSKVSAL